MNNLFAELTRRNVFRVAAAYVIVAWLLAQVADLALENFAAPEWVMKTILLLFALGLPVAIIFAWAFELTPDGIQREKDVDREQSVTPVTGRKLDYIIITLLAVALVYFVYESRFDIEPVADLMEAAPGPDDYTAETSVPKKSIAVLPFATFGGNESDAYLSDGLAETLLHLLAQIDELQVAARTSAFKFKGTNEDVRIIGEQLGVATVLEGSVQRSGDRIRITAQLINVEDGFHIFSKTFDREMDDIFAVQDEIAAAVVDALEVTLLGKVASVHQDVDAYDALMRLRSVLRTAAGDEMLATIEGLVSLTMEYPNYADAFAALSDAYRLHAIASGTIPEEIGAKGIEAGRRAVELAPDSATGYVALGNSLTDTGYISAAAPIVERAFQLQPGNADVLVMQGEQLGSQGRYAEAADLMKRAMLRDPLNANTRDALASSYQSLGRNDLAIDTLNIGLDIDPGDLGLLRALGQTQYSMGRLDRAASTYRQIMELDASNIYIVQELFFVYFDANDMEMARHWLERGELLSRNRLADERALYCYELGDTECWHAATARMLATRKAFFVQTWQSRMLYESGLIDEAIQVLLPVVEAFDQTDDSYGNFETRTNLARLLHLIGDPERRDEVLEPVTSFTKFGIEHGNDFWFAYFDLARAAAARSEVDEALVYLQQAYERGYRQLWLLPAQLAFDSLRDHPDFQSFVERIRSENAKQLESLRE